jgi:glycosyltransferase involved in cell wall biosynthesis
MTYHTLPLVSDGDREEHVGILMAVFNGGQFLQDQLDSFDAQDHRHWHLVVSDDGSTDESGAILESFEPGNPITRLKGPGKESTRDLGGVSRNFLSLLRAAPYHLPAGSWLSLADQDDVWLSDRLSRGIEALRPFGSDRTALYCSRTWVTDSWLAGRKLSPPRPRPPSFRNALVQNIAAGNTILLNPAAAQLVVDAAARVERVVVHDWWIYQMVTGAGGNVVHDDYPTLLYRQHGANAIGANDGARARARRIWQLLRGDFRAMTDININALSASAGDLTDENRAVLEEFSELRRRKAAPRLKKFRNLGLYRQSRAGDLALWFAALTGRL